jgi:hypothetical protein
MRNQKNHSPDICWGYYGIIKIGKPIESLEVFDPIDEENGQY